MRPTHTANWQWLKIFNNWILTDDRFCSGIHRYQKIVASISASQIFFWILCIAIAFEYRVHVFYLVKMKLLTYMWYKEHSKLDTKNHGLIAVNTCQTELAKNVILLSDVPVILYKAGLRTDIQDIHIKFNLSAGTYFIDHLNAKVKGIVNLFSCGSQKLYFNLTFTKTLLAICYNLSRHYIRLKSFLIVSSSCISFSIHK